MTQAQLIDLPITNSAKPKIYKVLARKTRPMSFSNLIGQEVLVQVLTNGLRTGRLPHAFIFTGIRGTGKTTTARILARALNCTGRSVQNSVEPCGICEHCVAIAEDRHIDVIEMDAASRTGVDDIRDVIESSKYKAVSAEYKIYIIDEVHMLSKSAFNALLKTLEEPPEHVKFIFATTEIRKVPNTVLSRCMRFDLRRVDVKTLSDHFTKIVKNEGCDIEPEAVHLLARAADGSVRDGLSLLDQAWTMSNGRISASQVSHMLGLADSSKIIQLLELALRGQAKETMQAMQDLYKDGIDPVMLVNEMLQLVHTLTSLKVAPDLVGDLGLAEGMRDDCLTMSKELTIPVLTRVWQILLKGRGELSQAHIPLQACEMLMLRVAYASTLPTPDEVLSGAVAIPQTTQPTTRSGIESFKDLVEMVAQMKEPLLYGYLKSDVQLISFANGRVELKCGKNVPQELSRKLSTLLKERTGTDWEIVVSEIETESPTLIQQEKSERIQAEDSVRNDPLVQEALGMFPGSSISDIKTN